MLAQIALHRKKRLPEFSLIAPNKGYTTGVATAPLAHIPSQIRRQLRPLLQRWADASNTSFAVLHVQGGARPAFTDVIIRMKHKNTKWPEGRFLKRPPASEIWTVTAETHDAS